MELVKCKIEGLGMELTGGWSLALVEHLALDGDSQQSSRRGPLRVEEKLQSRDCGYW